MEYTCRSLRRRRNNSDKWEVTFSHKDPLTGEVIRTYHSVTASTKAAAVKARDNLRYQLETQESPTTSTITVKDLLESFINYKDIGGVIEQSTVKSYGHDAKVCIKYIGNIKICNLSIPDVSDWMADMVKDGYAPRSCIKPFRLLKQALKLAIAQDIIKKNPCDYVKPPKNPKRGINTLNRAEHVRMLDLAMKASTTRLGITILLALTTGMRRGELCAIRWSDLDANGILHVNRALGNGNGGFYEKNTKGESSRDIPLIPQVFEIVMAYKKGLLEKCRVLGMKFNDPYLLGSFDDENAFYNPTRLGKEFYVFCQLNDFKCTLHDLRHTFATFMIASGVDIVTVSNYLGHADIAQTLNIYASVDQESKLAAVSKIEQAFELTPKPVLPEQSKQDLLLQTP